MTIIPQNHTEKEALLNYVQKFKDTGKPMRKGI